MKRKIDRMYGDSLTLYLQELSSLQVETHTLTEEVFLTQGYEEYRETKTI